MSAATAPAAATVASGRRTPFLWCSLEAIAHLRATITEPDELRTARSLYLALAELASRARDGEHAGFPTTRAEIAACAVISERRLGPHLERLAAVGLLEIHPQTAPNGRTLANLYRLVDPPEAGRPGTPDAASPPDAVSGDDAVSEDRRQDATASGVYARTRHGEEEKERERERARTDSPMGRVEADYSVATTDIERDALRELETLAQERSLVAMPTISLVAAMRDHTGVDPVAAARRLRAAYGTGGRAERRPILNLGALYSTELERSTAEPPRHRKGRKGRKPVTRTMLDPGADQPRPTIVPGRPAPELVAEGWRELHADLENQVGDGPAWAYLSELELLGVHAERDRTVVLAAPPAMLSWLESKRSWLTPWLEAHLGDGTGLELVPAGSRLEEPARAA